MNNKLYEQLPHDDIEKAMTLTGVMDVIKDALDAADAEIRANGLAPPHEYYDEASVTDFYDDLYKFYREYS
jgi:hypothetical protein